MIKKFFVKEDGSIAPYFALSLLVVVLAVAVTISIGQAQNSDSKSQDALDSATLAYMVEYVLTDSDDEALRKGSEVFYENASEGQKKLNNGGAWNLTIGPATVEDGQIVVRGSARNHRKTEFSNIAGKSSLPFEVNSEIRVPVRAISVALIPDVSASMRGIPFTSLKDAVNTFGDTVFGIAQPIRQQLEVGMAPYAGSVNISQARRDITSVLVPSWTYIPNMGSDHSKKSHFTNGSGCNSSQRYRHVQTIQPLGNSARIVTNEYEWKIVGYDAFGNPIWACAGNGVKEDRFWTGCVEVLPSDYTGSQRIANRSRVPIPATMNGGFLHCPASGSSVRPQIRSAGDMRSITSQLVLGWGTAHDLGMIWGRRLLEPSWADFFGKASRPWNDKEDNPKYAVFLSDGKSVAVGWQFNNYPSRRASVIRSNAIAICEDLKRKDVIVFGISYLSQGRPDNSGTVKECASEDYFYEADRTDIGAVFEEVAREIILDGIRISN